ncbi:MAG: hypothetical protein ABJA98_12430 [Acidobacteriota bacterium]
MRRITALRPHVHVLDRGDEKWRGGVVWAISGAAATLRVRAEAWATRDYAVATSDLPCHAIGAPIVVRVTGSFPYTVAEIQGSHFTGGDGVDQAGKIAAGIFEPACVPRSITGESEVMWTEGEL